MFIKVRYSIHLIDAVCDFGSATTRQYQPDSERERHLAEEDISR